IYDTGEVDCSHRFESLGRPTARMIAQWYRPEHRGKSIGAIRNLAIKAACEYWYTLPDIIVTFDSDDWSHPQRIAEQVALLQASGADCVGYREAVFYDTRPGQFCGAWIYRSLDTSYAIGASLAFHKSTWERVPFPEDATKFPAEDR